MVAGEMLGSLIKIFTLSMEIQNMNRLGGKVDMKSCVRN